MPYLGIFRLEFEIVIFEISTPKFVLLQNFCEETKALKFGTKNTLFGYFWGRIWKNHSHIWNQHPRICLIAKFCVETKMPKFGTKNAWFGYFWAGFWKRYCQIWNQQRISSLEFTYLQNFARKQKCLNWLKCLIWLFLGYDFKKLLPYLTSTPSNLSTWKISRKNKMAKFGTNLPYFGVLDKKCLICVLLG